MELLDKRSESESREIESEINKEITKCKQIRNKYNLPGKRVIDRSV